MVLGFLCVIHLRFLMNIVTNVVNVFDRLRDGPVGITTGDAKIKLISTLSLPSLRVPARRRLG